jgi:hypothetical protein
MGPASHALDQISAAEDFADMAKKAKLSVADLRRCFEETAHRLSIEAHRAPRAE